MKYEWENYTDKQLLNMKLSDFNLSIYNHPLFFSIQKIEIELISKALNIPLSFYFSTEWFCPDNSTSIAVPFYLAHPRLINLEIERTGWAEGNDKKYFLKLLRHEVGHIIDYLYNNKKTKIFGNYNKKYPNSYIYNPHSKQYVKNLNDYYAQAHPSEDFAETFAVWLDPNSNWKEKYKQYPIILSKLEYINSLLLPIYIHRKKENYIYIDEMNITLKDYYKRKNRKYNKKNLPKNCIIL